MYYCIVIFVFLIGCLTHARLGNEYAYLGLQTWFCHAIPALFPFMTLSGVIIRLGLSERFAGGFHFLLNRLYGVSKACSYVIFMGFLCGFPMGSKTIADLYKRNRLSKAECRFLLAFCNNLGPAFFFGVVLAQYKITRPWPYLIGSYGLPLIYGYILRKTYFRNLYFDNLHFSNVRLIESMHAPKERPSEKMEFEGAMTFSEALTASVENSMKALLNLGGYMILFSLLNIVPHVIYKRPCVLVSPLLEITTGIKAMGTSNPVHCFTCLAFGGLSCIAQTHASLSGTDLTKHLGEYVFHKVLLSLITFLYYYGLYSFAC